MIKEITVWFNGILGYIEILKFRTDIIHINPHLLNSLQRVIKADLI